MKKITKRTVLLTLLAITLIIAFLGATDLINSKLFLGLELLIVFIVIVVGDSDF